MIIASVWVHIISGAIGLSLGALILVSRKGTAMHKELGKLYVIFMTVMGLSGMIVAMSRGITISFYNGLLVAYLVLTGWFSLVGQKSLWQIWTEKFATLVSLAISIGLLVTGFEALQSESGKVGIFPAPVFFFFATVAAIGWISDIRYYLKHALARMQGLTRKQKLLRHIWRMNFALFMATAAFFLGQAKLFPEELREPFFLIAPVASVLLAMSYWLIRTRFFNPGDSKHAH